MKLSIITAAYNEEAVLPLFIERTVITCKSLLQSNVIQGYEIVIIDDGSTDRTWDIILENHQKTGEVKGVKFSRNFGQHSAISAGLDYAKGDFIVYLDSDLQAQPEDIPKMLQEFLKGFDVVWGVARDRRDSFLAKIGAKCFYWIFNKISSVKVPKEPIIAGCSKIAADSIKRLREVRKFSIAQWTYVGFKTSFVEIDKKIRFKGSTKYKLISRFKLALIGFVGFSKLPLKIASFVGSIMSFSGIALGIYIVLQKIFFGIAIAGYASLFAAITFFFGIQFLLLWIIGEYIGIIVDEVKKRPLYIVQKVME